MFTCLSIVFFGYLYLKEKFISNWAAYLLIAIQMTFILLLSSRMQILIMAVIAPMYFISYYYKKNLPLGVLYTLLIFFAAYFFIFKASLLYVRKIRLKKTLKSQIKLEIHKERLMGRNTFNPI